MAYKAIEFVSGLIKDDTPLTAKGGFINAQWVRFRQGRPQMIGGYAKLLASQFSGKARGAHAWSDLNADGWLAFGTDDVLYAVNKTDLSLLNITPPHGEGVVDTITFDLPAANEVDHLTGRNYTVENDIDGYIVNIKAPNVGDTFIYNGSTVVDGFSCYIRNVCGTSKTLARTGSTNTINGSATYSLANNAAIRITLSGTNFIVQAVETFSAITTENGSPTVTVYTPSHEFTAGQSVTLSNCASVGGLTINGTHTVASIVDRNTWTYTASGNASSDDTGGPFDWSAAWMTGLSPALPSVWSLDNFGEVLLANRRGGSLYAFQPSRSYPELVSNGSFATSDDWALGTGWSIGAGVATKTAGTGANLSQNIRDILAPGYTYRIEFDATVNAGSCKVQINAGLPAVAIDVGECSIDIVESGSYSRLFVCPADAMDLLVYGDASFDGTIDNVSIKLESAAFRVADAPGRVDSMFVDGSSRIVVLLGTYEADGDYNPTLVRWSAQENFRQYIPSDDNLSGEYPLSAGGRIVGSAKARQQNFIWTDVGPHSMRFSTTDGFDFTPLGTGCGLIGKNAAVEFNGGVFWLANDGNFYELNGMIPTPVDCRIRKDISDHIASGKGELIYGSVNSEFSECWWFYPDSRDGSECSRYAVLNPLEKHWTAGALTRTAWIAKGIFPYPVAFGADGYIYKHEFGNTADGSALTSSLESGYFDLKDGGNMMRVDGVIPEFHEQQGNVSLYAYTRNYSNGSEVSTGSPYTLGTATLKKDIRRTGRQMKFKLSSSASPSYWRLGSFRVDIEETGQTR